MALPATQKKATIQSYLSDPYVMQQIEKAIPKHMTAERLLRVSLTSIQTNPRLLECTPKSLLSCIMMAAQLGLEPNPVTGHAALVPFKNNKKGGIYEAQFQVMYKGLLALVRRSGELQSVQAQVVYEKDTFVLQYGLEEKLEHTPFDGERGKPKGSYIIFRYKDGGYSFDYMSRHDIEKIRKRSRAKDDGPWVTDWDEMAKKTVIKRHCKLAPVSIEIQTATALDDRIQMGDSQMDLLGEGDPIDIEADPQGEGEEENPWEAFWQLHTSIQRNEVEPFLLFVEETATANNCTTDDVKASITDENKDVFLAQFRAWQDEPKKEPAKLNNARSKKTKEKDEEMVPCPDGKGEERLVSYCNEPGRECRQGCPSFD